MNTEPKVKEQATPEGHLIDAELSAGGTKKLVRTRSQMIDGRQVRLVIGVPPAAGPAKDAPDTSDAAAFAGMARAAFGMR